MVRKDPANERGPAPPGGRITTKAKLNAGGRDIAMPTSLIFLQPEEEYHKLWRHILIGTGTCIKMIESYVELGMPGDPLEALVSLRNRLNTTINKYEANK